MLTLVLGPVQIIECQSSAALLQVGEPISQKMDKPSYMSWILPNQWASTSQFDCVLNNHGFALLYFQAETFKVASDLETPPPSPDSTPCLGKCLEQSNHIIVQEYPFITRASCIFDARARHQICLKLKCKVINQSVE